MGGRLGLHILRVPVARRSAGVHVAQLDHHSRSLHDESHVRHREQGVE